MCIPEFRRCSPGGKVETTRNKPMHCRVAGTFRRRFRLRTRPLLPKWQNTAPPAAAVAVVQHRREDSVEYDKPWYVYRGSQRLRDESVHPFHSKILRNYILLVWSACGSVAHGRSHSPRLGTHRANKKCLLLLSVDASGTAHRTDTHFLFLPSRVQLTFAKLDYFFLVTL
jgi:hypothetical protein